jgi:hypothetical protein
VRSIVFTTAIDGPPASDPVFYELYGTNDPVVSGDNSNGMGENWTLINAGLTEMPPTRGAAGLPQSFSNATPYAAYRVVFPDVKNFLAASSMQIGGVGLFASTDGIGPNVLLQTTSVRAIQLPTSQANSPPTDGPVNIHDGDPMTKYRNFGKENAGFIVTPQKGATVVTAFAVMTANDQIARDPASWALYGTNDPITSGNFSRGVAENWTLIDTGSLDLPETRLDMGPLVVVNNTTAYKSYRMVFPSLRNTLAADSVQFADIQFFGFMAAAPGAPVPEPASDVLVGCFAAGMGTWSHKGRNRRLELARSRFPALLSRGLRPAVAA